MNPDVAWPIWSRERAQRVESALERALPAAGESPQPLHAAMRYAVLGGGKRVRALLAYASGELAGADPSLADYAAVAVELIHAYSLIHDDLPCMDDDVLRRGKPTCHVAHGEAIALLAGDALQALAFDVLAGAPLPHAQVHVALLATAIVLAVQAGGVYAVVLGLHVLFALCVLASIALRGRVRVLALAEDAWLAADFPLDADAVKTIADQTVTRFTRDIRL